MGSKGLLMLVTGLTFNANGDIAVTSTVGAFDFNGAWNDGLNVNVRGYAAGSLIYDTTVVTSAMNPTWFRFVLTWSVTEVFKPVIPPPIRWFGVADSSVRCSDKNV